MTLAQSLLAEMKRRAALLPDELDGWSRDAEENRDGLGIHGSQLKAIAALCADFKEQQAGLLEDLAGAVEADDIDEFTGVRFELDSTLSGSHALIEIFRELFNQRQSGSRFRDALDTADLVAAACYNMALKRAADWDVVKPDECRAPPLGWLNSRTSPAAIRRGRTLEDVFARELDDSLQTRKLPVPVMSLRFHDCEAIWSLCSVYHEAGHLVDFDLDLRTELAELVTGAVTTADEERAALWRKWTPEMLADAFGVLWGGAGYAHALADLLLIEPSQVSSIQPDDVHPTPTIRIALLAALLRQAGPAALAEAADRIWAAWEAAYHASEPLPDDLIPYIDECPTVAETLIDGLLLEKLDNHSLRDLTCGLDHSLEETHANALALAEFLQGEGDPPDTQHYPLCMVPAAARLALLAASEAAGGPGDLDRAAHAIHDGAMSFRRSLPRPEYMADPDAITLEREEYLKRVAARVRFGSRHRDL